MSSDLEELAREGMSQFTAPMRVSPGPRRPDMRAAPAADQAQAHRPGRRHRHGGRGRGSRDDRADPGQPPRPAATPAPSWQHGPWSSRPTGTSTSPSAS